MVIRAETGRLKTSDIFSILSDILELGYIMGFAVHSQDGGKAETESLYQCQDFPSIGVDMRVNKAG